MTALMDESEFREAVKAVLSTLLEQVDDIDSDDHDPTLSGGNLHVVFEDGSTFVLSQQPQPVNFGSQPISQHGTS